MRRNGKRASWRTINCLKAGSQAGNPADDIKWNMLKNQPIRPKRKLSEGRISTKDGWETRLGTKAEGRLAQSECSLLPKPTRAKYKLSSRKAQDAFSGIELAKTRISAIRGWTNSREQRAERGGKPSKHRDTKHVNGPANKPNGADEHGRMGSNRPEP